MAERRLSNPFPYPSCSTFSTYESDIWLKIESLPNLQSLTAENYDLLRRVNVRTLKVIFARIRFLTFNSVLNTSPSVVGLLEGNPRWSVEDLSIDCDCGVDVVKFISCCPSLRKLDFRNGTSTDTAKLRGQKGFEDLVTHLKTSANLRYLEDLSILVGEGLTERELVTFLGQVRGCLRRVQFQVQMEVELNILSVLKVHFKTLTDVELTSKVPGISSEIMASCQALTHARLVLFPSDISDKRPWVCKSMISFHIRIPLKNGESSLLERALCLRISDLTQLEYIHLDCSLPGPTATRKLDAGGMDLLLKLTKLKYLNLGRGVFSEIDSSALSWIVKFQGLKQVLAFWEKGSRSKTLKHIDLVKRGD